MRETIENEEYRSEKSCSSYFFSEMFLSGKWEVFVPNQMFWEKKKVFWIGYYRHLDDIKPALSDLVPKADNSLLTIFHASAIGYNSESIRQNKNKNVINSR